MNLSFGDIWDVADNTETVTVRVVDPAGAESEHASVTALLVDIRAGVVDAGGVQMTPDEATWHLKASDLSGVSLDRGDRVVSSSALGSGTWAVKSADLAARGARWECDCQRLEG